VARVTSGVSESSNRRVGHFLCFAGVGFDALIVEKIQPELKARLGAMAYVMTGFDQMFKYQEVNRVATIQVDDQPPQSFAFWQIIISNIQTYGGGLRPAPRASMHDGLLDLILWPRADLAGTIHQVVATATGAHLGLPDVKYIQGQRFWIDTEPTSMIQIDGDLLGPTPVLIEVLPQALWTRF
jgi:diacylglycerol kinase family enzyme